MQNAPLDLPTRRYMSLLSSTHDVPASTQPYLSSPAAGWAGLSAEAFHEPTEGIWSETAAQEIYLCLVTGGSLHLELQLGHGNHCWMSKTVNQGDLLLLSGRNLPFAVHWKSLFGVPTYTFRLRLSQDFFTRIAEEVTGSAHPALILPERVGFKDPLLTHITLALWRELQENSPGGTLFAQCAAQLLAIHLVRHYTALGNVRTREPTQKLTSQQLDRVIACIQKHAGHDLSLDTLAQQTGFSLYHFARLFRQTTGESPHHFVLRQRIEHARHLIVETELPLAQIAQESGFTNQSHFTRVFKRFLGMTPYKYKQECSR